MHRGDGPKGSTRFLPDGCLGGETPQSGGAAITPLSPRLSPCLEAGPHDCRPGGQRHDHGQSRGRGGAVQAQGGGVKFKCCKFCTKLISSALLTEKYQIHVPSMLSVL